MSKGIIYIMTTIVDGFIKIGKTRSPLFRKLAEQFNFSPNTIRNKLQRGAHLNTGKN